MSEFGVKFGVYLLKTGTNIYTVHWNNSWHKISAQHHFSPLSRLCYWLNEGLNSRLDLWRRELPIWGKRRKDPVVFVTTIPTLVVATEGWLLPLQMKYCHFRPFALNAKTRCHYVPFHAKDILKMSVQSFPLKSQNRCFCEVFFKVFSTFTVDVKLGLKLKFLQSLQLKLQTYKTLQNNRFFFMTAQFYSRVWIVFNKADRSLIRWSTCPTSWGEGWWFDSTPSFWFPGVKLCLHKTWLSF